MNPQLAADILLLSMRRFLEPEFLAKVHLDFADAMDEVYELIEYGIIGTPDAKRGGRKRDRTAILRDAGREPATLSPERIGERRSLASADAPKRRAPRARRARGRTGSPARR